MLDRKPQLENSIRSQLRAMQTHFPEALVIGYEPLIAALELPDADDRHVFAAAIQCGADYIVTDNLADFPVQKLEPYGIEALDADEFLSRAFELAPSEAIDVLRVLRLQYNNPPYSQAEFIFDLTAKGLPKLAAHASLHRTHL